MTRDGPAPQRRHAPPTGPPARPAEPSSPGRPAPGLSPGPDPARTTAPAGAPQPAGPGSRPEPLLVAEGHTRGAPQPTNDEADPPAPPTQPRRGESTVGEEEMQGPPQGTPTPTQMGDPGGGADRPSMQSADPPHEAAHGSNEALAAGQPDAEPKGPTPDTDCEDGLHRPSAADHASAASLANLALRADASTPGGAPQGEPPETRAGSETWEATPDTPQERLRGEHHPTDTTATTTPSMPSWSPAGMTPTRSQHRRRHASTRSRDATRRKTHPSRHHAKHTRSAITLPWGRLPLRVRGRRP